MREDVNDRLTEIAFPDASDIIVAVVEGEVPLNGAVGSRMAKRRAKDKVDASPA